MKEKQDTFFDFASIYREKIPVNDEFCAKQAQKWDMMELNANTGIHLLIFSGKNPL